MNDDCPSCDGTGWVPMPEVDNTRGMRRIRFKLIKWLARGDTVLMNSIMVTPFGWAVGKRELDAGGLVVHNSFVTRDDGEYEYVPGSRMLWRIPEDADD